AGCAQQTGVTAVARNAPANLTGLVVDGFQLSLFAVAATIGATPSHRIVARVVDVPNAECAIRIHIEQAGLWTEGRRVPVRGAGLVRRDERSGDLRTLFRIGDRLPAFVGAERPVGLDVLSRDDGPAMDA